MLLHIIQPDAGEVTLFGQPLDGEVRNRVGYLPEERGLYRNAPASDVLVYLGRLKGLSAQQARKRAKEVLEQLGMAAHARKKVSELSRGMSQLIQFGAALIHDPSLVILDEPFAGLDPVNTQLLKDLVTGLRAKGVTVIFSTHLMGSVEELCDRVLMVNHGRAVLYGQVAEVKERYRNNSLFIDWDGPHDRVAGVAHWEDRGPYWEAFLADGMVPEGILQELLALGGTLKLFQISSPSLNEVFIKVASTEVAEEDE